ASGAFEVDIGASSDALGLGTLYIDLDGLGLIERLTPAAGCQGVAAKAAFALFAVAPSVVDVALVAGGQSIGVQNAGGRESAGGRRTGTRLAVVLSTTGCVSEVADCALLAVVAGGVVATAHTPASGRVARLGV